LIRKQYQKIMAFFYDPFMKTLEKVLVRNRTELIENIYGKVLEVGSGTGVNFELFAQKNAEIYAIEPSVPMYKRALKQQAGKENIKVFNIGIEDVLRHKEMPKQYDFVISMLVLCTVEDAQKAAKIYHTLLKENGKLLVLEHIHSQGTLYGKFQTFVNPIWKPFADGCNLTRRQDQILKETGFKPIEEKYFKLGTDWYQAVMIKK